MENTPFTSNISEDYIYESDSMSSVRNKLALCIQNNSFALLTGEPGTGKSTFLRAFSSKLHPDEFQVLYVSMSNATPRWIYTVPLEILGVKPHIYVNDARKQFHEQIRILKNNFNKRVVMIIDEAHLLTQSYRRYDLIEEIRFLLNGSNYDSGSPLSLILSGQNEIWDVLKLPKCKAIRQRIMYVCRTNNILPEEVKSYIAAHLRWSKCSDNLFSSEAVEQIALISEGIPRIINKICMHSLNYAALQGKNIVTKDIVLDAANNEVLDLMFTDNES